MAGRYVQDVIIETSEKLDAVEEQLRMRIMGSGQYHRSL
jgi:hypothetical protein